jgi:hypothetical protein
VAISSEFRESDNGYDRRTCNASKAYICRKRRMLLEPSGDTILPRTRKYRSPQRKKEVQIH